ncbi:MAG: hypothetical protein E7315_00910 [Clostridiales bacterium]|nr:hypothetical protein [Clostridiales bacterium]
MKYRFANLMYKIKSYLSRCYKTDELGIVLLAISLLLSLLSYIPYMGFLTFLGMGLVIWEGVRFFSLNYTARRRELDVYLKIKFKIKNFFSSAARRIKDRKKYKYFKCKVCKTTLRVPRGKGKVKITCKSCGNKFIAKT